MPALSSTTLSVKWEPMKLLLRRPWHGLLLCCWLVLTCGTVGILQAQTTQLGKIKDWKIFDFYEPGEAGRGGTNQLKTLLSGATAEPRPNNIVEVSQMWLGSFDEHGDTNLVTTAPQCTVDTRERTATSPGPVQIQTGLGQLSIQGIGFHCRLTNIILFISNSVETIIRRELIQSSDSAVGRLPFLETAPPSERTQTTPTNAPIRVSSDHFLFHQSSNIAVYSDQVHIEDPRLVLTCHQLIIHFSTNGSLQKIVAEQEVVILDKASQGQASGDRAVYQLTDNSEWVELTGLPARWKEGSREGSGNRFVFEPRQSKVLAPEQSLVRLSGTDFVSPVLIGTPSSQETGRPAPGTNQFVEITSLFMDVHLPSTNQPARTVLASNQVVIVNPADQSQATGQRAFYSEQTGILELTGMARWESGGRLLTGDAFYYERTNQVFRAQPNAYVRLPLSSLGSNALVSQLFQSTTNTTPAATQFLELFSDQFLFRPGQIRFQDRVRGVLWQEDQVIGRLFCGDLTLHLASNQMERIVAQNQVVMEQPPALSSRSNLVEKHLTCEWFAAFLDTNGHVRQLMAQTNVLIRQTEYPSSSSTNQPLRTDLRADVVTAWFAEYTNDVDRIVAENNVLIEQVAGRAKGSRAVYSRAEDTLVLSGEVVLETPTGLLNAPAAILKHFGLWPGRLSQLGLPLRPPQTVVPRRPKTTGPRRPESSASVPENTPE
jgi:lipopolysaccharide export system protein LptA